MEENIGDTVWIWMQINRKLFLCSVDLERAFDKIQHNKMLGILRNTRIHEKDYFQPVGNKQRTSE